MPTPPSPSLRRLLRVLLLALLPCVFAQDGLEVGLATYPTEGFTVDVHAALPLFETRDVTHAARADLAWAFDGLPALALTYRLSGAPGDGGDVVRYLGAGLGLSFPDAPIDAPLLSLHGLVGARLPLTNRLHAFAEASVAGNAVDSGLGVGIGVGYAFGDLE